MAFCSLIEGRRCAGNCNVQEKNNRTGESLMIVRGRLAMDWKLTGIDSGHVPAARRSGGE
jgi:hypothetical protein